MRPRHEWSANHDVVFWDDCDLQRIEEVRRELAARGTPWREAGQAATEQVRRERAERLRAA